MLRFTWRLVAQSEAVVRYCQGCGRVAEFRSSLKIRRNANGKTIHQFDIWKCERDHTWNRKVPVTDPERPVVEEMGAPPVNGRIALEDLQRGEGLEIRLEQVLGRWRLDKALADRLEGLSRTRIAWWIERGLILVNGAPAESRTRLRSGNVIALLDVS